jgi:hypothetical protein
MKDDHTITRNKCPLNVSASTSTPTPNPHFIISARNPSDQFGTPSPDGTRGHNDGISRGTAAQTGRRISVHPNSAIEELRRLNKNWPDILKAIDSMDIDRAKFIEPALAHLKN